MELKDWLLGLLGTGAGGAALSQLFVRKKTEAEAEKTRAEARAAEVGLFGQPFVNALTTMQRQDARIAALEQRLDQLERRAFAAEERAARYRLRLIALGQEVEPA